MWQSGVEKTSSDSISYAAEIRIMSSFTPRHFVIDRAVRHVQSCLARNSSLEILCRENSEMSSREIRQRETSGPDYNIDNRLPF